MWKKNKFEGNLLECGEWRGNIERKLKKITGDADWV
jgi:hypothetical protein